MPPPRDLAEEQAILRQLVELLPWLRMRKAASEFSGIADSTFAAIFADKASSKYRPLTDPHLANTLWAMLRDTVRYVQVALPEQFRQIRELSTKK